MTINRPSHRLLLLVLLALFGMASFCFAGWFERDRIVVVQGTTSVTDASERSFAKGLADRTDAWLTELGLPHKRLSDDQVGWWRLRGARVVILPYNPHPAPAEVGALRSAIKSGAILIVCYGMDPDLATLMQVKLSPYRHTEPGREWTGFTFCTSLITGLAQEVRQRSEHWVPAAPLPASSVLATWNGPNGVPSTEPAWLRSPAGFWMTHVLLADNDEAKKQLLLALLATKMPGVWNTAAEHLLDPDHPFGTYATLRAAEQALGAEGKPDLGKQHGAKAYTAAKEYLGALSLRYARMEPRPPGIRAIWVNPLFLHVGTPPNLISNLISNFVSVASCPATPGLSSGQSSRLSLSPPLPHAWLTCMNLESATPEQIAALRAEHRLQVTDDGDTIPWLCPSNPTNRMLLATTVTRLAQSKRFAGIHLDYIRCNNRHACYCPGCRQRFEQTLGRTVKIWPTEVVYGPLTSDYRRWRADQVGACVAAMSAAARAVDPALRVSAAVYGGTPACVASVAQEWPDWLKRGWVDFVCPMNYTAELTEFAALLKAQAALGYKERIVPGIGVTTLRSRLTADQAIAQVVLARDAGFAGVALFEYTPEVEESVLKYMVPVLGGEREERLHH